MSLGRPLVAALLIASMAGAFGCRGETSPDPPFMLERNMFDQERYNAQSHSEFFADKGTMRPLVEGVVSQEGFRPDPVAASGLLADGSGYVMTIPKSVEADFGGTAAMLERGRQRFNIFCVPCHGASGDGKGTVARVPAGFPPLPSYAEPRIRQMPDGQMFATISNGARLMPPYGSQIRVNDRWAIVSYVRALEEVQLASQGSPK